MPSPVQSLPKRSGGMTLNHTLRSSKITLSLWQSCKVFCWQWHSTMANSDSKSFPLKGNQREPWHFCKKNRYTAYGLQLGGAGTPTELQIGDTAHLQPPHLPFSAPTCIIFRLVGVRTPLLAPNHTLCFFAGAPNRRRGPFAAGWVSQPHPAHRSYKISSGF